MAFKLSRILASVLGVLASSGISAADLEVIYTTRPGDTLIGLEKQFLAAPHGWQGLQALNNVDRPRRIPVGSSIRIPEDWLRVEPRTARVIALRGSVSIDGRPLTLDQRVPAGSVLKTSEGAFVTLLMPDDSRLTIQPGSEARVEKVQGFRGLAGQNTQILLDKGRLDTAVSPQRGPAARYLIRTPTAVIGVRGTAFRVGSEGDGAASRAEVTGGEIAVSSKGVAGVTALPAGFGVVARPGQAIPAPRPLLPAPVLSPVSGPLERVALSFPFESLARARAYRAQIAGDERFDDVIMDSIIEGPPARFTGLPDGNYWLHLRAIDEDGLEGYNAVQRFELRARPEVPRVDLIKSEPDGQTLVSWAAAPEAAAYRLKLTRGNGQSAEQDTSALNLTLPLQIGDYQVQLASLRADGQRGPWGEPQHISIRRPPGVPTLTVYNQRLRFAWSGQSGQLYDFQIARDEAFTDLVVDQRVGEAAITVPAPAWGFYYVRMRALDPDGGVGAFSGRQRLFASLLTPWWTLSAPKSP